MVFTAELGCSRYVFLVW